MGAPLRVVGNPGRCIRALSMIGLVDPKVGKGRSPESGGAAGSLDLRKL